MYIFDNHAPTNEAKQQISADFREGLHEMEAGYPYGNDFNDHARDLIAAFAQEHGGECWLGLVNLSRDNGSRGKPPIWKWTGGLVYNFGARFVIPKHDAELERLILERDQAPYTGASADYSRIHTIFARIDAIGGEPLFWN